MRVFQQFVPPLVFGLDLIHPKGVQQVQKQLSRRIALSNRLMQRNEDRMHRLLRRVIAFIQHGAPRIKQTSRNCGISDFVSEIVSNPAVGIDALEVWTYLAWKEKRCDVEVLIMRRRETTAPCLSLRKAWPH